MKKILNQKKLLWITTLSILASTCTQAEEIDLEFGIEGRYFPSSSLLADYHHGASFYIESEYYNSWTEEDSLTITIFARKDEHDEKRSHADLQELTWVHAEDSWELRTGVRIVYWGVTEAVHLVDIINQTDFVENIDGEDKLGQPMVNLSVVRDFGIFDFYLLPRFRERTFPGANSRLRIPIQISDDIVIYESKDKDSNLDFAARWSHFIGDWEIGLSYFNGTNREPRFTSNISPASFQLNSAGVPELTPGFVPELYPVYEQIEQIGLDLLYIYEGMIVKLELIERSGECWTNTGPNLINFCDETYAQAVGGFEYTQVGIFESAIDLGWVVEGLYDDRGDESPSSFEHDVLLANRFTFNDTSDTSILMGVFWDPKTLEKSFTIETSRRIGESVRASIEGRVFDQKNDPLSLNDFVLSMLNPNPEEKLRPFGDEDFIQIDLTYYF